jgi:hypothetical protein
VRLGGARLAACTGVAALVALALPLARGEDAPAPAAPTYSFVSANSGGDGLRVFFDIVGFLPITPALSLSSVSAEAFVETTRRTAVALLPDPGGTVVAAPGLAAGLVGIPNIPGYPLIARADDPFTPTAEASPVQGSGLGTIRAEASADRATALARAGRVGGGDGATGLAPVDELVGSLLGQLGIDLGGPLVDLGAVEVHVDEQRTAPSTLRAEATSTLSGISLLGGLVRIASVETRASARLDGATASADQPTVEVAGVTVAGIPAAITERGLTLAGSSSPLGALLAPLTDPLLQQGLAIRLAPSERHVDGTTAGAKSGGLSIEVTSAYQGYPVVLRITLGEVRASVQGTGALPAPSADAGAAVVSPGAGSGGSGSGPSVDLGAAPVEVGSGGSPSIAGPEAVAPRPTAIASVLDARRLYPFVALLAGLLAGSRLLGAALLRRRRTPPEVRRLYRW